MTDADLDVVGRGPGRVTTPERRQTCSITTGEYDDVAFGVVSRGPRGARGWAEGFLAAVPDLVVDVVAEYVSDGDEVVERLMSGTHRGEFDGLSPTGRRLQVRGVSVPRTGSPASFVLGLLEHRDGAPPTGGDLTSGQVSGRIFTTSFASVYAHYATKVEKKGRTTAELDQVIEWLTGLTSQR